MAKVVCIKIAFVLFFCCLPSWVNAQTNGHKCGTVSLPKDKKASLESLMKEIMAKQLAEKNSFVEGANYKTSNTGTSCIPIKVHDIRDGAGAGAVNMTKLNQDLANLNYHFQAANIEFYFCGTVSSVNNATHYDFLTANESALLTAEPSVTNAFNLYLVNSIDAGSGIAGYAYFPGNILISTVCIMDKNVLALSDNGTIVHEYGHHFNLLHTHEGTENGNTDPAAENVPRSGAGSNCSVNGDLLCDTEADPRGTSANCLYTGGGVNTTDILGNGYTPPIDNIMSYYPEQCGGLFTAGQITRIVAARTVRAGHSAYTLTCAATAVTPASGLTAVQSGSQVNLNWTDNAANELGYLIERSTTSSSAGFSPVMMGGVAANAVAYSDNTVLSNTTYWYRIKASNGNCNTYSNVATVTTGLIYCTPSYNAGGICLNATISNFTFTGNTVINNTTTCASPAYTDYSGSITSSVTAGNTYNFSVTMSAAFSRYVQIFVDYNQDGDFLDANEKVLADNTVCPVFTYNGTATIPSGATNGTTKMRVVLRNQSPTQTSACETAMNFGETEDYGLIISGGALPVELLSFEGKADRASVILNWSTAREVGNDRFELEKSEDGKSFTTMEVLKGKGNASVVTSYETIDPTPFAGVNFYRLKQVNTNGAFTYSGIISVNTTASGPWTQVSPNPTTGQLEVEFETRSESLVGIELQDLTGKTLLLEHWKGKKGSNKKELMLDLLPQGVYLLRIITSEQISTHRIVKQ